MFGLPLGTVYPREDLLINLFVPKCTLPSNTTNLPFLLRAATVQQLYRLKGTTLQHTQKTLDTEREKAQRPRSMLSRTIS